MNRRAYQQELMQIVLSIPEPRRGEFFSIFLEKEKNPVLAYGWNLWLGWLGADRFYNGQVLLGVLKLLTLGGFGLWVIVDWFLAGGTARDQSIKEARSVRDSMRA